MSKTVDSWAINSYHEYIGMIAHFKKTDKRRLRNKIAGKSRRVNRSRK